MVYCLLIVLTTIAQLCAMNLKELKNVYQTMNAK